jgi:hypothetical protein
MLCESAETNHSLSLSFLSVLCSNYYYCCVCDSDPPILCCDHVRTLMKCLHDNLKKQMSIDKLFICHHVEPSWPSYPSCDLARHGASQHDASQLGAHVQPQCVPSRYASLRHTSRT